MERSNSEARSEGCEVDKNRLSFLLKWEDVPLSSETQDLLAHQCVIWLEKRWPLCQGERMSPRILESICPVDIPQQPKDNQKKHLNKGFSGIAFFWAWLKHPALRVTISVIQY